ncbi:transglutaminase-like domain-containing protein [Marinimicrobium alkaliphilum]|uniref:transglutaminase-like domain-containing protein n=1 Tax=Marinimicrobium alkaliphilum TaxID=2202654 RepID=UPI0018E0A31B|nr:transglutaminase-like domain-containing protein [Marinimicrobium alkaliphilum]
MVLRWLFFVMLLLAGGCASPGPPASPVAPPDSVVLAGALSGAPLLGRPYEASELPEEELFALSRSQQLFAEENTGHVRGEFQKARALHNALLLSTNHGIRYYPYLTLPPGRAFENRVANCVSFTLLFVAMARHLGLNAEFNEVDVPDAWDMRADETDDYFVLLRHVNGVVNLRDRSQVIVDLEMERYSPVYPQRAISPESMAALYYNNRAMELMTLGQTQDAFLYLRKALTLSADRAYIWSNLAVLYRRAGFAQEAEALYQQALQVRGDDLTAITNLGGLYRHMGEWALADKLAELAERHRRANPYYLYTLARRNLDREEWDRAYDWVQQAIAKEPGEPRFYELLADIYEHRGDGERARALREHAESLLPDFML